MGKKKRSKDPKCDCAECEQRVQIAQQLVGKCSKCDQTYCIQHRLPEMHDCHERTPLSEEDKTAMIQSMRCVATKV